MRAAVVEAVGSVSVQEVEDPTPGPGEVVVEVAACGLCGTDLHILDGEFAPSLPIVPGHEMAGTVVAHGRDVEGPAIGTPVAVDPSLYCHECWYCRHGRDNLCERWGAIGVSTAGGAATYVAAPAANCVPLPPDLPIRDAALVEPLSCAVRGYDVLRSQLGSSVLVYGSGTMGLMMLTLAQRVGAASVDVVDVNPERLASAERLGSSRAVTDPAELEQPRGWDLVVDATGNVKAIQDGLGRVAPGGTFLQFGVSAESARVEIEPYAIYNREITITGSMAVLHSFERAARLFATGVLDADFLISHRVPLEDYPKALEMFARGEGRKIQVVPAD